MKRKSDIPKWLISVVVTALVVAVILLIRFIVIFGLTPSGNQESWGQFGDFVGGILNPLFSIIGLMALLYTIKLQSKEMRKSTKELKSSAKALKRQNKHNARQQFDNNFFQLLSLNIAKAESVSYDFAPSRIGQDAFRFGLLRFRQGWDLNAAGAATWIGQFSSWRADGGHAFDTYMHSLTNIFDFIAGADVSASAKSFAYVSISSNLSSETLEIFLLFATFSNNHSWAREILEADDFFKWCQMDYLGYRAIWDMIGPHTPVTFDGSEVVIQ